MMRTFNTYQQGAGRRTGVLFRFGSSRCLSPSAPFGLFITLLTAMLLSASCSELDVRMDTEHSIHLSVYSDVATKGSSNGPLAGVDFPDNRLILLSAHYTDPRGEHNQNLFTDITFSKYGTPARWQAGTVSSPNVKYWPFWGTMDFIAVTKATSSSGPSLAGVVWHPQGSNAAAKVRYDMPDNSSIQDDVMFAFAGGRDCEAHENVPMIFRHAQAQVAVSAASTINTTNVGISVRGVYLCNAYFSGLVEATAVGTDSLSFVWFDVASSTLEVPVWLASPTPQRLSLQQTPIGHGILVPAQSPAGVVSFRLDITIHDGLKADGTTPDDVNLSYMYTIPSGTWIPGKKYQYAFTISLTEIICEMTISDDWNPPVDMPEATI